MTARKSKAIERRAASGEGRRQRVWRLVDYEGRFAPTGMPAGREVAQYAKWYLNAWQGPGGEWLTALNRLRADKEFIWEQGAIVELLTIAMNQQAEYQGYLVTGSKVPMTASEVGSIVRVDGRKALAFLTRCEAVGILERVAWPEPDGRPDGDIQDNGSLRFPQKPADRSQDPSRKGGEKRRFRNENAGPPLKKSKKIEKAPTEQTVEVGGKAPPGGPDDAGTGAKPAAGAAARTGKAAQTVCPNCGHTGQAPKGSKALQCTQCNHVIPAKHGNAPTPTTSIPSTSPDGGGGPDSGVRDRRDSGRKASPAADFPGIVRLADVLDDRRHRYSQAGNEFGEEVLSAMGATYTDRGDYVNEVAHWAKLYERGAGELTEPGLHRVKVKVIRVAGDLRAGRTKATNPQAFLLRTMQNEIRDQKRAHRTQTG